MRHDMSEKIKSVVILGGGTAGWLTALLLRKNLDKDLKISLIESKQKPIIGVGEATVPTIRFTMQQLGFDEADWMPKCQASYKLAVKFDNWLTEGHSYYHPFHHNKSFASLSQGFYKLPDLPTSFDLLQIFSNINPNERTTDFARFCSFVPRLCDDLLSPLNFEHRTRVSNYAYHFDTYLLNQFFRSHSQDRNIDSFEDTFKHSTLTQTGSIESITMTSGKVHTADLFIDCTGFNSLLLGGSLKEDFVDQKNHLLCDSALATQLPYENKAQELEPYTSAIAMKAGWVWKIPLQHRIGTGYVYSSKYTTDEEALNEFRTLYPSRSQSISPRYIKMKVGRYKRTWVKNCVAIGLAGCFVEPLESTSIGLTEYQIHSLIQLFPDSSFPEHLQNRFNEKINFCYDQLRDYIVLHYFLSKRKDTEFWKSATSDSTLTESLKKFMHELPSWLASPKADSDWVFFQRFNYGCILSGMNALPHVKIPILDYVNQEQLQAAINKIRTDEMEYSSSLPKLDDYLQKMRNSDLDKLSM
jgi:hypothetical protein